VTETAGSPQLVGVSEPERPSGTELATFDDVYARELDYVWRTLGRLGVPSADLADATHDVFFVVFQRWADFDATRPVRPWLFGIARRVAAAVRRREPVAESVEVPVGGGRRDARDDERDLLWIALAGLDEDRRVVVILHDLEGHTSAAIAEMLAVPVNTVSSRLRLARADLVAAVRRLQGRAP
jgi:RNA polymerase sigma-70 factor (ECF subfamily)